MYKTMYRSSVLFKKERCLQRRLVSKWCRSLSHMVLATGKKLIYLFAPRREWRIFKTSVYRNDRHFLCPCYAHYLTKSFTSFEIRKKFVSRLNIPGFHFADSSCNCEENKFMELSVAKTYSQNPCPHPLNLTDSYSFHPRLVTDS